LSFQLSAFSLQHHWLISFFCLEPKPLSLFCIRANQLECRAI
jgi:hypothetical protein